MGFILVLSYWIISELYVLAPFEKEPIQGRVDWIVVLGCGNNSDNALLHDRLVNTENLARQYPNAKIILTGNGEDGEIAAMHSFLTSKNEIESNRLVFDSHGYSTWLSLKNVSHLIQPSEKVVIVTNEFHQPRSLATARHWKMNAALAGDDHSRYGVTFSFSIKEHLSRIKLLTQVLLSEITLRADSNP